MPANYDHLSREEAIRLLHRRDRTERRFGLVWERNEIEHEHSLNADFVALDPVDSLCVGQNPFQNLLIEGSNFDALRYLRMTHTGKIKCILIDPPYNTGNQDFIYNDRFVDKDDSYRHSKWLEVMFQTLSLARDLLRDDGVIFVNIGEEEVHRLGCLMDQVFPGRKVASFVWRRRSGANDAKEFFVSQDHEYVLCYANPNFSFEGDVKSTEAYKNPDNDPEGAWNNDNLVTNKSRNQRPNAFYPIQNPTNNTWYTCDPDNTWRFSSQHRLKPKQKVRSLTMEQIIEKKKVLWPQNDRVVVYNALSKIRRAVEEGSAPMNLRLGDPNDPADVQFWDEQLEFWVGKTIGYGKPRYKRHKKELKRSERPFSTWFLPASLKKDELEELDLEDIETLSVGYTSEGTSVLQQMLGNKDFPYPKPLSLVQGLVKQSTTGDDIVLDFFAGSGTTGHAVLAQNELDGQNRTFILVSSTEATAKEPQKNICRDITQKRLAAAINGYSFTQKKKDKNERKNVDGLEGNFLYALARRIPTEKVVRRIDHPQIWLALQLMNGLGAKPFEPNAPFQGVVREKGSLLYLPEMAGGCGESLRQFWPHIEFPLAFYGWNIEAARALLLSLELPVESVGFHPVPQILTERFGLRNHA